MNFTEFITDYMKQHNLSYRQMGQLCNISHAEISRLAKGKQPSIKTINKISTGTDIPKNKLLATAGYLEDNKDNKAKQLKEKLPQETFESLDEKDLEFLIELSQDDQRQMLLRESRKLSDDDLAKIIKIIRTFAEEEDLPAE
ncbi:helix-turn-helix domain-containing protein [Halanaerobaculum tunisiense]